MRNLLHLVTASSEPQPKRVSIRGIHDITSPPALQSVSSVPLCGFSLHSRGIPPSVANSPNYSGVARNVHAFPNWNSHYYLMLNNPSLRLPRAEEEMAPTHSTHPAQNDAVHALLCLGHSPPSVSSPSKNTVNINKDQAHNKSPRPSSKTFQASANEEFGATMTTRRPFHQETAHQKFAYTMRPKVLSLPSDAAYGNINSLHRFVRSELLELFEQPLPSPSRSTITTKADHQHQHRPRSRVGLRCVYCAAARKVHVVAKKKNNNPKLQKKKKAVATMHCFFPKSLEDIYLGVCTWQRIHFPHCENIPKEKSQKYSRLKEQDKRRGKKAYWANSAYELGLRNISLHHKQREGIMWWCQESWAETPPNDTEDYSAVSSSSSTRTTMTQCRSIASSQSDIVII